MFILVLSCLCLMQIFINLNCMKTDKIWHFFFTYMIYSEYFKHKSNWFLEWESCLFLLYATWLFLISELFFFSYNKCRHNLFILSFWTSYAIFVNADSWKKRAVENFHLNCVNNCDKRHLERSAVFPLYLLSSLSFFFFFIPPLSLLSLHPHSMTSNPKYLSDEFCCRFFFTS